MARREDIQQASSDRALPVVPDQMVCRHEHWKLGLKEVKMTLSGRLVARSVIVTNPLGLHLRACAEITKTASAFDAQATIRRGKKQADAESILDLMMLSAEYGTRLLLEAQGADARRLLDALESLFECDGQEDAGALDSDERSALENA
jgi:phosphotransferase system HPr (HPr) family protein